MDGDRDGVAVEEGVAWMVRVAVTGLEMEGADVRVGVAAMERVWVAVPEAAMEEVGVDDGVAPVEMEAEGVGVRDPGTMEADGEGSAPRMYTRMTEG